jgi:hypothetical protein
MILRRVVRSVSGAIVTIMCCIASTTAAPDANSANQSHAQGNASSDNRLDALEKQLLASRERMRAGRLELTSRYTTNKTQSIYETFTTHFTVYFDGPKLRMDREKRFTDHRALDHRILNRKQYIRADARSRSAGLPDIEIYPASVSSASQADIFHPKLVGLFPEPIARLPRTNLFNPFERADRTKQSVSDVTFEGRAATLVNFEAGSKHQINVKIWLTPDGANEVLGIRVESTADSVPSSRVWEIISAPKLWPPNDLPYPSRVTYRYYEDASLIEEEIATVEALVYDQPPDDTVFTLAAIQPEQGREAIVNGTDLMAWNDGKLAPLKTPVEPPESTSSRQQRLNWLLLANGVFLLGTAALLVHRMMRKRGMSG